LKRPKKGSRKKPGGRENRRKSEKTFLKVLLFVLSLGIIPLDAALLLNFPLLFRQYSSFTNQMVWATAGFGGFLLVFMIFGAPVKSYILEHELSHMLFALLSGIRIQRVSFKSSNAYVKTERINIFIALAPYSLPLYTVILLLPFRLLHLITDEPLVFNIFCLFIGMSLSFHIASTIHYVQIEQPDLRRYGYFSSLILVFTWSIIILSLLFTLMFRGVQLVSYYKAVFAEAGDLYRGIGAFLSELGKN
jgi:hypothetical protein